jgi:hypothetical protein
MKQHLTNNTKDDAAKIVTRMPQLKLTVGDPVPASLSDLGLVGIYGEANNDDDKGGEAGQDGGNQEKEEGSS